MKDEIKMFECLKLECKLTKQSCIKRQKEAIRINSKGLSFNKHTFIDYDVKDSFEVCYDCDQGKKIAGELNISLENNPKKVKKKNKCQWVFCDKNVYKKTKFCKEHFDMAKEDKLITCNTKTDLNNSNALILKSIIKLVKRWKIPPTYVVKRLIYQGILLQDKIDKKDDK